MDNLDWCNTPVWTTDVVQALQDTVTIIEDRWIKHFFQELCPRVFAVLEGRDQTTQQV